MRRYLIGVAVVLCACGGPQQRSSSSTQPRSEQPPALAESSAAERPVAVIAVAPPEPEQAVPESAPPNIAISSASGWSTFHGDASRTGASAAPPIGEPRILWKSKIGIFSWLNSPLVLGKSVVIVPTSGNAHNKPDPADGVVALDLASGKRLWHARFAQDANGAAATDKRVFSTSDDGNVYAIELSSGKIAWRKQGSGKMYTHPLVVGSAVIVGDAGGWLYAHDVADGNELWKVQLTGAIRGGASFDGKLVYASSQGGEVVALVPASGKVVWRKVVMRPPWNNRGRDEPLEIYSAPIVDRDTLYVPFARDTYYKDLPALYALNKKDGSLKWRAKGPGDFGNLRSTPVLVAGKLVYGEPYSGDVVAINAGSGRMAYRKQIGPCYFPQWASPAAAGDQVYLPRFDGTLYAIEASSGRLAWELYLGDSARAGGTRAPAPPSRYGCEWDVPTGYALYSPAAIGEDGTLVVGSGEGVLYAIASR